MIFRTVSIDEAIALAESSTAGAESTTSHHGGMQDHRKAPESVPADQSEIAHTCYLCGHTERIYRLKFRDKLIPALEALSNSERALSLAELSDLFDGSLGRYVSDYFAEIRHWNLAEKIDGKWRITETGRGFLSGSVRIPEYRWQRDKGKLPESCVDGPMVFIHELDGYHPAGSGAEHAELSMTL